MDIAPDWQALRGKFPALSRYSYFNTATHGPVSDDAARAASRYYLDWSNQFGQAASDRWYGEARTCRANVARLIGAESAEIGFVPNTSTAISCAALLFEGSGAVLTARGEHPAVVTPWHARKYRVDVAEPNQDGLFTPDCYEKAIKPDTRIIAISHVRFDNGQVNDLAALGALARTRGLHLVVDVIQSIGILPVDVGWGIDVLGFAGFKWLNAGHGSGAIYVRDGLMQRYGLPIAGNRSRATEDLVEIASLDPLLRPQAFELGTISVPNVLALGASLRLIDTIGADAILERVGALTRQLRAGLDALGLRTATDLVVPHVTTPIVSIAVPDTSIAYEALVRRDVHVAVRGGTIRVAVSWYNDADDVDRCLDALAGYLGR